ncbi:MAG TPA: hypothetical protein VLM85_34015 [Polyangiaceae bacterium]|nr:hypothetical protein [Polyangiaceae bacterium]
MQGLLYPRLAMDDTDVYWLDITNQPTLQRTPRTGGATATLATLVNSFTVDTDDVYYDAVEANDAGFASTLYALPKAGGPPVPIAGVGASSMVVDTTTLYFLGSPAGAILGVPKTGGAPVTLTSGTPHAGRLIGVDATAVYWISGAAPLTTIWATPKMGGTSSPIAQVAADIRAAALDADNLYFTTSNQDLVKLSKASSTLTTLTSGLGENGGDNLAVTSGVVYVNQQALGQYPAVILAVPTDGSAAQTTCAGGSMGVSGIAVDATTIVWGLTYEANGTLLSLPR